MGNADMSELLARLKEAEELLRFASVPGHVDRGIELLMSIARTAPSGGITNLAMQAISEANALRPSALPLTADYGRLNRILWRLRLALQRAAIQRKSSDVKPQSTPVPPHSQAVGELATLF
jgi:hypothetical protein